MRTPAAPAVAPPRRSTDSLELEHRADDTPARDTWIGGLTKTQAEELLDWLEAHGCPHATLSLDGDNGFAVRYQWPVSLQVRRDPGSKLQPTHP